MDGFLLLLGFGAGLVSTGFMFLTEVPAWRSWGLVGVLEWHENQALSARILRRPLQNLLLPGLLLHFLHGGLGGAIFLWGLGALQIQSLALPIGVAVGILLWSITLIIHRPITGVRPWAHPIGRGPALLSLAGHLAYGISLGLIGGWL